jgi:hypothetical protein
VTRRDRPGTNTAAQSPLPRFARRHTEASFGKSPHYTRLAFCIKRGATPSVKPVSRQCAAHGFARAPPHEAARCALIAEAGTILQRLWLGLTLRPSPGAPGLVRLAPLSLKFFSSQESKEKGNAEPRPVRKLGRA